MNTRERKREREWKPPLPFETAAGSGCGATLPVIARSTRPQLKHIIMVHHQKNIKDEASIASSLILDRCHLCHFCISESIAFGFDFNWGARSGPAALLFPFHLLRFSMYPLIITLTHTHTHTYIYIYIYILYTWIHFLFLLSEEKKFWPNQQTNKRMREQSTARKRVIGRVMNFCFRSSSHSLYLFLYMYFIWFPREEKNVLYSSIISLLIFPFLFRFSSGLIFLFLLKRERNGGERQARRTPVAGGWWPSINPAVTPVKCCFKSLRTHKYKRFDLHVVSKEAGDGLIYPRALLLVLPAVSPLVCTTPTDSSIGLLQSPPAPALPLPPSIRMSTEFTGRLWCFHGSTFILSCLFRCLFARLGLGQRR